MLGVAALLALGTFAFWHWSPVRTAPAHIAAHVAATIRPAIAKPPATLAVPASLDADAFAHRLATNDGSAQPAWAQLLALWNVRSNEDGGATAASCPPVLTPGLFCASGNARLSRLAQFDRPAILRLRGNGRMVSTLLLGLGSTQALLQLDGDTFRVRRVVLENALVGYTAIWRGPGALAPPLKRDDTGPGVAWLRARLLPANARGANSPTSAAYDIELIAAVRGVQRDFGLRDDGVAGPETLLALMTADPGGPHLRKLAD
jgi:general secretion pathway protein A